MYSFIVRRFENFLLYLSVTQRTLHTVLMVKQLSIVVLHDFEKWKVA